MELRDYVRVLRKGWALILAVTIVGLALGVGLTLVTKKVYEASTEVFVSSTTTTDPTTQLGQTSNFITARVQSYPNLATSPAVLSGVIHEPQVRKRLHTLHRKLDQQQLASKVSADAPVDKVIINLHVTDTDPFLAAVLANGLTKYFNYQVENVFEQQVPDGTTNKKGKAQTVPAVQLTTSHNAVVSSAPIKPDKALNIGLGFVLGLLIGLGVAVLREVLDNTVKSAHDFEALGVPLLAQVAFDKRAVRTPIAFRSDAHSARSEAYRQLRTNLQFVDVDNPPRIIAVTSAVPGEGKSSTAINLAASLAEAGGRVCLIEADLRRPSIAKSLGLVSDVGFTTAVIGKTPVETVLQNAGKNLAVLTSGPIPPNPSELLISQHAKQVIFDIAEKVDFVIIDTPPLLPVTDGAEIATIADATILVHRAARTTRDQAARSIEALAKVGRRPVGVVLNMVTRSGSRYDYEYGYYYAAYRPTAREPSDAAAATEAPAGDTTTAASAVAVAEKPAAPATVEAPASTQPAGRRARHRGRRAAAAAATDTMDTDSFVPVSKTAAASRAVAEDATNTATDGTADETVPVEPAGAAEPTGIEADPEPTTGPVAHVNDAFADEYDEYDDNDDNLDADVYDESARPDDDTVQFGAIELVDDDAIQDESPLNERINGNGQDEHSFDDALGVRGGKNRR